MIGYISARRHPTQHKKSMIALPSASSRINSLNIGTTAKIELRPEGGIERSLGKAKRVVDLRKG